MIGALSGGNGNACGSDDKNCFIAWYAAAQWWSADASDAPCTCCAQEIDGDAVYRRFDVVLDVAEHFVKERAAEYRFKHAVLYTVAVAVKALGQARPASIVRHVVETT